MPLEADLGWGQVGPKPDLGAWAADQGLTGTRDDWCQGFSGVRAEAWRVLDAGTVLDEPAAVGTGAGSGLPPSSSRHRTCRGRLEYPKQGSHRAQKGPSTKLPAPKPTDGGLTRQDLPDDADAARPQAALLEKHLLGGEKQPPSTGQGPVFYIGGTNGASVISSYCKSKGWQRTQDSQREDCKLKWCEVKCRDTYCRFREGEQLLFQLPNNQLLTTKIGLLRALREHARVVSRTSKPPPSTQAKILKMEEFFPETYRLDIRDEREAFFTLFDETQMWICKPTASNQGKGIFLVRNQEDVTALQAKTQSIEDAPTYRKMPPRAPQARVVQRYIKNPLLLDGKKFDVRSYLLIACATPYMVFFGHGYARLTLSLYDPCSSDLSGHLTNQFMQKKSPLYMLFKEDTVWSMEHLNRYINDKFCETKGLPRDWVFTTFTKRMQQIMAHCFLAVKSKLECKLGYFDLIGCDFLIDENFKVLRRCPRVVVG
ncbi:protein polyglycylase TTLL10 isoform 2 [Camelus ferus]|nr:protein polyglycylase TTLL10 isoform 2 [Camelus ferus]